MAEAGKKHSTVLEALQAAVKRSPELIEALGSAKFAQALAANKLPGTDLTRVIASIGSAKIGSLAELHEQLAKYPELFKNPLEGLLAKIDAADHSVPPATDVAEKEMSGLEGAIKARLKKERPGGTVSWKLFCDNVRNDCGDAAWISRKDGRPARGYGNRTIKRIVSTLQ